MSAIPLSLIWTSPLVDGIKLAITVLTGIILLIPLVLRIFQARFLKKRKRDLAKSATAGENSKGDTQRGSIIVNCSPTVDFSQIF